MKKVLLVAATVFVLGLYVLSVSHAGGGMSGGALEVTQLANNVELIKQVEQAIKTVQNQIVQIENMVFNTLNLPNQILSAMDESISTIRQIGSDIEGVAYQVADLGERFQSQFEGFKPTDDYVGMYRDLAKKTRETSENAIKTIEKIAKKNEEDAEKLVDLSQASGNAQGHQQAVQAGNQILAFMGEQLIKLQEINMNYSTFLIEQIQARNEKEERTEANLDEKSEGFTEAVKTLPKSDQRDQI